VNLKNKIILIVSPQSWGNMFLAKHHYAMELAKYGNEVYFLNPPQKETIKNGIEIIKSNVVDSLYLINHSLTFPYQIKFKWKGLFHFLIKFHIKKIEASISKKIDIVWSFDLGDYYPFKYFSNKPYKIFFPIDEPLNKVGIDSATGCDIIFSITNEILDKYAYLNVPKYFIHHGLSEEFIHHTSDKLINDGIVRVGLSGNLLRPDIDIKCLLKIIEENPEIIFEFWGSYQINQSNIGGSIDTAMSQFVEKLQIAKNVVLHGPIHPKQLAIELQRMDAFLITYDILKDQSKGTNYHKVMEYLSTGKVVVSNNISTYSNIPSLIEMCSSRIHNNDLPFIFKNVINNLKYYNQIEFSNARKEFAMQNLYSKKITHLEERLNEI
jgi:hypothetical protein